MSERGVFAVDRGIWDHPVLNSKDPLSRREAWLWMLSEAAWKPRKVSIDGKTVTLERGQMAHSVRFMADKWGWSKSAVVRFLDRCKTETMIETQSGTGQNIITICNYDDYQKVALPNRDTNRDSDRDSSGTVAGHQRDKEEDTKNIEDIKPSSCAVAKATRTEGAEEFQEFWKAYPKRDGGNPKKPAAEKFYAALKAGATASEIIAGAKAFATEMDRLGKVGTAFVPMAKAWLHQQQWCDFVGIKNPTPEKSQPPPGRPSREELMRIYGGDGGERTDPGRDREAATRPGESVLRNGEGGGNGPMLRVGPERPRVGPMQGVGSILQRSLGLDADRDEGLPEQSVPDHDDADGMAPMVRREFH